MSRQGRLLIYLPLSPYLREWAVHALGSPVRFPRGSYEHALLGRHLSRPPRGADPQLPRPDAVAVEVPVLRGKPMEVYNYLPRAGRSLLREAVLRLFVIDLWSSLSWAILRPSLGEAIEEWCRSRGIAPEHREAVRRRFYRIRSRYNDMGLTIGRRYRLKSCNPGG